MTSALSVRSIKFLGQFLTKEGVQMDPAKVEAIQKLPRPHNVPELRLILGMLNFVQKFVPGLADQTRPLRELPKKGIQWTWGGSRREGVSSDEAGVEFPSSLVPLQSRPAYQGVS